MSEQHTVGLPKGGKASDLRAAAARLAEVSPEEVVIAEVRNGKVTRIFDDYSLVEYYAATVTFRAYVVNDAAGFRDPYSLNRAVKGLNVDPELSYVTVTLNTTDTAGARTASYSAAARRTFPDPILFCHSRHTSLHEL